MLATESKQRNKYAILPGFSTYGAVVPSTVGLVYQSDRSRTWSRPYKNRKSMLVRLLADGYLPTTAYTDNLSEIINSKVCTYYGLLNSDPRSTYEWSIIPSTPRDPWAVLTHPSMVAAVADVTSQLQSRISGHGTNLAVSAKEARQTVGMVGDAVSKLALSYRHVRQRNFKAAAQALGLSKTPKRVGKHKTADENWLEYRYGWRLVVYDVNSLMKTLYDSLTLRPPLLRVTGFSAKTLKASGGSDLLLTLPNGTACMTVRNSYATEYRFSARAGYVYELSSVPLATGQSLGLVNPATFLWEIIPYSFVVDWVLNVGSVLEGLTAFTGKTWKDGWLSKTAESHVEYSWTNRRKSSSVYSLKGPENVFFSPVVQRLYQRTQMQFTPASLRIDLDLNVSRVTDAIALIKQGFTRR